MFSDIDMFGMFILELLSNRNKFICCCLQHFMTVNVSHFNTTDPILQFIYKFIFFLTIFDNS